MTRSTPPEQPGKHYVRPAAGKPVDDDEGLAMGYALFDKIAADQARKAREDDQSEG